MTEVFGTLATKSERVTENKVLAVAVNQKVALFELVEFMSPLTGCILLFTGIAVCEISFATGYLIKLLFLFAR